MGRAVGTSESEVRVRNWSITGFIEIGNRATISRAEASKSVEIGIGHRRPPISIPGKTSVKRVVITPTRGQCVPIREGGEQRCGR